MQTAHLTALESDWSVPAPDGVAHARAWHLQQLTDWLTRAGAEPRLCLVICSGAGAKGRLIEALAAEAIEVVSTPATPARPLHPQIAAHRGDHFNSKLHLIDGFEAGDPTPLFAVLDGQRGQLRRMATWVAVVVESLGALAKLSAVAPGLAHAFMHRAVILDEGVAAAAPAPDVDVAAAEWTRLGRVEELSARVALDPRHVPSWLDFTRLVRAGYAGLLPGLDGHPERQRLAALWAEPEETPFRVEQAEGGAREALLRRAGEAGPTSDLGGAAQVALDRAAAAAAAGDLDGCGRALAQAEKTVPAALPELLCSVLEKRIAVFGFQGARGPAQAALARLEAVTERLASPWYRGRMLLTHAGFVAELDPARARTDREAARRIFATHGYPEWAARCD